VTDIELPSKRSRQTLCAVPLAGRVSCKRLVTELCASRPRLARLSHPYFAQPLLRPSLHEYVVDMGWQGYFAAVNSTRSARTRRTEAFRAFTRFTTDHLACLISRPALAPALLRRIFHTCLSDAQGMTSLHMRACILKLYVKFVVKHADFVQWGKCALCGDRSMTSPAFHLTCLPVSTCGNVMASFYRSAYSCLLPVRPELQRRRATLNSYSRATPFHACAHYPLRAESKHLL
jgi:hypothetical protein